MRNFLFWLCCSGLLIGFCLTKRIPMGKPIPQPNSTYTSSAGSACSICWGSGKKFGSGSTPDKIYVSFSGINKGPTWSMGNGEPLEGIFEFTQDLHVPCLYNYSDANYLMYVQFDSGYTTVAALSALGPQAFSAVLSSECSTFLFNELASEFEGGSAELFIPEVP